MNSIEFQRWQNAVSGINSIAPLNILDYYYYKDTKEHHSFVRLYLLSLTFQSWNSLSSWATLSPCARKPRVVTMERVLLSAPTLVELQDPARLQKAEPVECVSLITHYVTAILVFSLCSVHGVQGSLPLPENHGHHQDQDLNDSNDVAQGYIQKVSESIKNVQDKKARNLLDIFQIWTWFSWCSKITKPLTPSSARTIELKTLNVPGSIDNINDPITKFADVPNTHSDPESPQAKSWWWS